MTRPWSQGWPRALGPEAPALVSPKQTQGLAEEGKGCSCTQPTIPNAHARSLGHWDSQMRICSLGLSGTQLGEVLGDYDTVFVPNIVLCLISELKSNFKIPQKLNS